MAEHDISLDAKVYTGEFILHGSPNTYYAGQIIICPYLPCPIRVVRECFPNEFCNVQNMRIGYNKIKEAMTDIEMRQIHFYEVERCDQTEPVPDTEAPPKPKSYLT